MYWTVLSFIITKHMTQLFLLTIWVWINDLMIMINDWRSQAALLRKVLLFEFLQLIVVCISTVVVWRWCKLVCWCLKKRQLCLHIGVMSLVWFFCNSMLTIEARWTEKQTGLWVLRVLDQPETLSAATSNPKVPVLLETSRPQARTFWGGNVTSPGT